MRCGLSRGRIEFMNSVRAGQDIAYYVIVSLVLLVVLWLNRNGTVPGTDVSVAAFMLPGLLALQVAFAGAFGVATVLATEREDGTLLRLKAVPTAPSGTSRPADQGAAGDRLQHGAGAGPGCVFRPRA